jgi:hypothetical protein
MRRLLITLPSETITDTHCGDCPNVSQRGPGDGWVVATCEYFGSLTLEAMDDLRSARRHRRCMKADADFVSETDR